MMENSSSGNIDGVLKEILSKDEIKALEIFIDSYGCSSWQELPDKLFSTHKIDFSNPEQIFSA